MLKYASRARILSKQIFDRTPQLRVPTTDAVKKGLARGWVETPHGLKHFRRRFWSIIHRYPSRNASMKCEICNPVLPEWRPTSNVT